MALGCDSFCGDLGTCFTVFFSSLQFLDALLASVCRLFLLLVFDILRVCIR
jgi:hypothetical protein